MKKYIVILVFLSVGALALGSSENIKNTNESSFLTQNTGFIATGNNIKTLEAKRLELVATLKLERERTSPETQKRTAIYRLVTSVDTLLLEWSQLSLRKIQLQDLEFLTQHDEALVESLTRQIQEKELQISQSIVELSTILDFGPLSQDTPFTTLQKEFPNIRGLAENIIDSYDARISDTERERSMITENHTKELEEVTREINRLKQIREDQIFVTLRQIAEYIGIFVFIYFAKIFSRTLLVKFGKRFSKSHQEALLLFHRWLFHILFAGAFLVLFAAEFISLLPFVAILGTAVGLALRDAIYSFIGWFVVGSSSGYQEGDFIEFENTQGRVYRIMPLLTNIEEYGPQGFTGRIVSFPNKTIFEKNIKNWSRGSNFSLVTVDFLLTHQSNIAKAKKILQNIVDTRVRTYESNISEIKNFKKMYGYTDDDITPQIHVASDPRGTLLRVRVLVHVQDRISEQSRITELFSTAIQPEKSVTLRDV